MVTKISILLGAAALLTAALTPPPLAATSASEREWISQKVVEAQQGYKLRVPGHGEFLVKRLRPLALDKKHAACLAHIPSIQEAIARGIANRTLDFSATGAVEIELKVRTCKKGFAAGDPPVLQDTSSSGGDDDDDDDDNGDDEEVVCCKGGGKGCVADISKLP